MVGMTGIALYGNSTLLLRYWEILGTYHEAVLTMTSLGTVHYVVETTFKRVTICLISTVNVHYSHRTFHSHQWA